MNSQEAIRRGIVNQGAFFSPYYLFDLLTRQHDAELEIAAGLAHQRELRRLFRQAWQRHGNLGSTPAQAWNAWYRELFQALGFALKAADQPLDAGRHGLVPISHVALPDAAPEAAEEEAPPLVLVDLHGFGTNLDQGRYPTHRQTLTHGSVTEEPIARAVEFALEHQATRWALVAAGDRLRLYRKGGSVARQYLEVNFPALFDADRPEEWTAFWGLFRRTAFVPNPETGRCFLDRVLDESQRHASRIADDLRQNIVTAVEVLIQGVLDDPANGKVLGASAATSVSPAILEQLFEESLYFMYRLLFVLYAESRDLLPVGDSVVYRDTYSIEHLRDLAERPLPVQDGDRTYIIETLRTLFGFLHAGCPAPGSGINAGFVIGTFNGHLFSPTRLALLDRCRLPDRVMRDVLREMSLSRPKKRGQPRERYSYADLGVDQLGSIYEGLLVYEPAILSEDTVVARVKNVEQLVTLAQAQEARLDIVPDSLRHPGTFLLRLWGGRRKGSGSYYTPHEITAFLVKEALAPQVEPIVARCAERDRRGRPKGNPEAILDLKVCDPAMGSGAFLIQACRFLAEAYGRARIAAGLDEDQRISELEFARYKRRVAERCLYGVDMNPLAVELAKVSLWLETLAEDRPLTFLDAHLRCGNSLVGAPLRDSDGNFSVEGLSTVPDAALREVGKESSRELKDLAKARLRRNREEMKQLRAQRSGQTLLPGDWQTLRWEEISVALRDALGRRTELEQSDEDLTVTEAIALVHRKEALFDDLEHGVESRFRRVKALGDLWCSLWFWPEAGERVSLQTADGEPHDLTAPEPPTTAQYLTLALHMLTGSNPDHNSTLTQQLQVARAVAARQRFFHWELEFPEVWTAPEGTAKSNGGFDAIVGNPPWETITGDVREFYSNYDPLFRRLQGKKAAARVAVLRRDPVIDKTWRSHDRRAQQNTHFVKAGGYRWFATGNLGKGPLNLYRFFVELNFRNLRTGGRVTQVLPDAFYVAANASEVRRRLFTEGRWLFLYVLENRNRLFPIDSRIRLALLGVERGGETKTLPACFLIGLDAEGQVVAPRLGDLEERLSRIAFESIDIPMDLIRRLAPTTWSPPELRNQSDVKLASHISDRFLALGDPASGWRAQLQQDLNASTDSDIFFDRAWLQAHGAISVPPEHWQLGDTEYWPLYDGRMIYHFDAHYAAADKWVPAPKGLARMRTTEGQPVTNFYRLAWRDVASTTNERTVIAAVLPPRVFAKHTCPTLQGGVLGVKAVAALAAIMTSFAFDYQARIRGKRLTFTNLAELLVPSATNAIRLAPATAVLFPDVEYGELRGVLDEHSVLVGQTDYRHDQYAESRARLDALIADCYGVTETDYAYILSTFPLLDRDQPPLPGERKSYVTRDLALAALFTLRGKSLPTDIVVFHSDADVDIRGITGPIRSLTERVFTARQLGAIAYMPSGHVAVELSEEVGDDDDSESEDDA